MIGKIVIFLLVATAAARSATVLGVLITGNSICQGTNASVPISTSQPFSNQMLNGSATGLVPLAAGTLESPQYGLGNQFASIMGSAVVLHGYAQCDSGGGWAQFGGSGPAGNSGAANDSYNASATIDFGTNVTQISTVKALVNAAGNTYTVGAVTLFSANTGTSGNGWTLAQTENVLAAWQAQYQTAAQSATGQSSGVPLLIDQHQDWIYFCSNSMQPILCGGALGTQSWAAGVFHEMIDNYGLVYLVGPRYPYPRTSDGPHFTAAGYLQHGELYGKALARLRQGVRWKPLCPRTITRASNVVTLRLHNTSGTSLVIDTTTVVNASGRTADWAHAGLRLHREKGFEFWDDSCVPGRASPDATGGDCPTYVQSVAVTGSETVTITLNQTPTGTAGSQHLRYAYSAIQFSGGGGCNQSGAVGTGNAGAGVGTIPGTPCGNIRNSDDTVPQNGAVASLADWLITFDEPIGFSWEPDPPTIRGLRMMPSPIVK